MKERKLLFRNPVVLMFLGAAPALAASTDVRAALGMSLAVMAVLLCSALVLGLLRKLIPAEALLPAILLVVAGFASMVLLLFQAFLPNVLTIKVNGTLTVGFYVAVLAADLLLFGAAEDAADFGPGKGLLSALECGFCFAVFVLLLAAIRELFGEASFAGAPVEFLKPIKNDLLHTVPGGLIVFSLLLAILNRFFPEKKEAGRNTAAAVDFPVQDKEAEA